MIELEINNFFKELNDFCQNNIDNNLVYFDVTEASNVSFSETYRSLIDYNFSSKTLRDLLISHIEQIQIYSPAAVSFLPYFMDPKKNLEIEFSNSKNFVPLVEEPSETAIKEIIEFLFENSSLLKPTDFIKIFSNNGFISKFEIKKSNSFQNACVFNSGFSIKTNIPNIFFTASKNHDFDLVDVNVILYDGAIESVSEINLILNDSYEKKEKYLIFCRGSHQDVERTCAVNFSLDKACVFLVYPDDSFWFDSEINKMMEMLSVDLYGFRTGRLLNNYEFEHGEKINCFIDKASTIIKGKDFQINNSAMTSIYLNENSWKKKGIILDQLNFFKSLLEQISLCGIISNDSLKKMNIDLNSILKKENRYYPAYPVIRALYESRKILSKISNIGLIIND